MGHPVATLRTHAFSAGAAGHGASVSTAPTPAAARRVISLVSGHDRDPFGISGDFTRLPASPVLPPRPRLRNLRPRPRQPGIKYRFWSSRPSRKAARICSTSPQICEITSTPAAPRILSNVQEMAPQIKTVAPWSTSRFARAPGSVLSTTTSCRACSLAPAMSINNTLPATSKTGLTRPCQ